MKPHPDPLAFLADELEQLDRAGLLRTPGVAHAPDAISFCSNDYLGLASEPAPVAPRGAGASRLISGERTAHQELERALAAWLGFEAALVFTSGYAANLGVLSALVRPGDRLVSDALNHASIIDGARLSRADVAVVPHNDVAAVEAALASRRPGARAWVVVESYYSMDADGPDLTALRAACDRHGAALVVDEAHALGVLGPGGRGLCAAAGVRADVLVGTLGKALGTQGAFVVGSARLRAWLWNRARSFVFSTGLAPVCAEAALASLRRVEGDPTLAARVAALAERLRAGVLRAGARRATDASRRRGPILLGFGHVVPIVVGAPTAALELAAALRARGVAAHAVRPPTVPEGTSRLRLTVTARHREEDIDRAVNALGAALSVEGAAAAGNEAS